MPSFNRALRPSWTAAVLGALLVVATVGCSGSVSRDEVRSASGTFTGLTVSGAPGTSPTVRIAAPLKIAETRAETLIEGTGAPVAVDQLFILQLTMYDARTGEKAISTYDRGQRAMAVKDTDGTLFPALSKALIGIHQGSRVVLTLTAQDAYGGAGAPQYGIEPDHPLVLIADVVAVPPVTVLAEIGSASSTFRADLPGVVLNDGVPERVETTGRPLPDDLVVVPLVEGNGPPVRAASLVTLRSLAQVWDAPAPFDDSFDKEPVLVPIGTGAVVEAWERALVGVRQGTRLLLVAPPSLAFKQAGRPPAVPGNATIVYVIDVLGVS